MGLLDDTLDRWRTEAASASYSRERDKGTAFERLCQVFLTHDSVWRQTLESPVFWAEWTSDRPNFDAKDLGVDLVAKLRNEDGWCAIQCKFRDEGGTVSKKEIDSFISASGSAEFKSRILIDTTGRDLSANAENAMKQQDRPVSRIGLADLRRSRVRWERYLSDGKVGLAQPKELLPHQQEAFDAVTKGLAQTRTRGKMIMACGTGKTLTSLRIAEELVGRGGRVLYLVPSLSLMSQTVQEWTDNAKVPLRCFAVCSDSQVGKRRSRQDDRIDMDAMDLALPATTDPDTIASNVRKRARDAMTVVFATYQSAPVIEQAQGIKSKGLQRFDLAICDEAHRTTGGYIEGEDDPSHFLAIHDNSRIRATRRLYMTATAKIYGQGARRKAEKVSALLCSMDDEDLYGPLLYEIGFGDAVDQGLLSDYKVVVLAIPDGAAARSLQMSLAEGGELKLDDAAKMIGCWRALAKVDKDEFGDDAAPMRRAIAFCRDIKSSQLVEAAFSRAVDEYRSGGDAGALRHHPCEIRHVDGTFKADARKAALDWLADDLGSGCHVLTNARCLAEGVDVPALDAILFMHPRKSQIDVVQAVGRVMRRAEGKALGYVVLPVVIPSGVSPEQALNDNERFRVVWQLLNAIRSHDERFDAMIQRIEMGEDPERLGVIAVAEDWNLPGSGSSIRDHKDTKREAQAKARQMRFEFDLPSAIMAKIVDKCGDRAYWEDWAGDVGKIAQAHIVRITALAETPAIRAPFDLFVQELRDDLNDSIEEADAIEMLAQHAVTAPVFEALFGEDGFVQKNAVAQAMQKMLSAIQGENLAAENESLRGFYDSVRRRVAGAKSDLAQQGIVAELYDKFFRKAFPLTTQRLGIVYTPVQVVDFILHSVERVLRDEFDTGLSARGVHVLDPFAGTGTFVTRLLQSGLIDKADLKRKYTKEIHANEIVLLAYYVATANIEKTYAALTGRPVQYPGICLTDTFTMQSQEDLVARLMPDNSGRRKRQRALQIRVIVGNPPWSAWQKSSADDNQRVDYPAMDRRIEETYAARSNATLKSSLYDSYKMAIRWASDRIGEQGVVAFVTNGSWIDSNVDAGIRACLAEEFSSVHVLNLRGNQRTQGEISRREGGKVFGTGSRAPVAISLLVRNPHANHAGCRIAYHDIGDYLTREDKLSAVAQAQDIGGFPQWQRIEPDENNDWLAQRDKAFGAFPPIGSKETKRDLRGDALFRLYSRGLATSRDAYIYNSSPKHCAENARRMVQDYSDALSSVAEERATYRVADVAERHSTNVRWDRELKNNLKRGRRIRFSRSNVWLTQYRPFVKQHCYVDYVLVNNKYQMDRIFPAKDADNLAICVPGPGSTNPFSALIVDSMPDLELVSKGQCFPRYRYEPVPGADLISRHTGVAVRVDNIADSTLRRFKERCAATRLTKDAVFYYVYGVLHSPEYRDRFGNDLAKALPRIPLPEDGAGFRTFSQAGRNLAKLHLRYDEVRPWPIVFRKGGWKPEGMDAKSWFRVERPTKVKRGDTTVRYNDNIEVSDIPASAWEYEVNGKPAIAWVMERQGVKTDTRSGIVNDANDYAIETMRDPSYPLKLLARVIRVSVETVSIVKGLPEPNLGAS